MAIITIFSGTHCHADEIARGVAEKLGKKWSDKKLIEETARRWNVSEDKLRRSMFGPPPLIGNFARERTKFSAYLKLTLAEILKQDNFLYVGFAGHLVPRRVSHAMRICVIANIDHRIEVAMKEQGISEKEARHRIKKDDEERNQWTQFLYDKAPYNENLYDIMMPTQATSIEDAVDIIIQNSEKEAVKTTAQSLAALEDFILAARVNLMLLEKGHEELEVDCSAGEIVIGVNKSITRLEAYMQKIKDVAAPVEGVRSVEVKIGSKYHQPSMISTVEFELPKKVLLVDDEKEFVHTLSERLQTRNLESSVVYNGEEALSFVKDEEPEVMVLDLKMPGIDGLEVLRRVKKEHPEIQVIILTGHGSKKEEELAMQLGAFAYMQKPVNIDVLANKMKEAYKRIAEKKASTD